MSDATWTIVGLNYVTCYVEDYDAALDFYTRMFGERENREPAGWRMGSTWLTVFPARPESSAPVPGANPRNAEFAIQVSRPVEVDALYNRLLAEGCTSCMKPQDTVMYESMRFSCVDDPFGMRIDVYCPVAGDGSV
ncbi:MAG: VOC family protein [Planctomycetota bacterium]